MTDIEDAAKVVQNAIDTFNARNFSAYFKLFTDDLESYTGVHTPLRFEGLPAWKEFIDGLATAGTAHYERPFGCVAFARLSTGRIAYDSRSSLTSYRPSRQRRVGWSTALTWGSPARPLVASLSSTAPTTGTGHRVEL